MHRTAGFLLVSGLALRWAPAIPHLWIRISPRHRLLPAGNGQKRHLPGGQYPLLRDHHQRYHQLGCPGNHRHPIHRNQWFADPMVERYRSEPGANSTGSWWMSGLWSMRTVAWSAPEQNLRFIRLFLPSPKAAPGRDMSIWVICRNTRRRAVQQPELPGRVDPYLWRSGRSRYRGRYEFWRNRVGSTDRRAEFDRTQRVGRALCKKVWGWCTGTSATSPPRPSAPNAPGRIM